MIPCLQGACVGSESGRLPHRLPGGVPVQLQEAAGHDQGQARCYASSARAGSACRGGAPAAAQLRRGAHAESSTTPLQGVTGFSVQTPKRDQSGGLLRIGNGDALANAFDFHIGRPPL